MSDETATTQQLRNLQARLEEAEETLRAVRSGEIDAFIVQGPEGERIYALRSAEQPYRNLVEDMFEGAAILTTDGDIAYCNTRFAELIRVPLEQVVGGSMERFVSPIDRPAYRALVAAGSGQRRAQLNTRDGRTVDVFLSFTTSVCEDVERRNLIITDLSELLDAQSGRNRAEQQSQAKDEFMAMLAHELRNPLSAITAAMQVLEAVSTDENASQRQSAVQARHDAATRARFIIGRQVRHLSRLVDDLLDVSRVVTGKIALDRRAMDFGELVRRTAAVFTERQSEHQFQIDTMPAWVEGDTVRIEQVVSNIIGNAVKYTPPGGHIKVSVGVEGQDAVLRVEDDGFGIAPELLPRIFELFVQGERTLDRAQGGLGIGLTLVRRLVNLHHGTVTVASQGPDCGSLVTVRLPKITAIARTGRGDNEAGSLACSVHRRILIIEDNRDAREMFRMMLELEGHEVLEAEEGWAGLRMLASEPLDVAFIDVGLPGLDGYEVARRYRMAARGGRLDSRGADADPAATAAKTPAVSSGSADVLLVALTGYGTPEALERSRCAGFHYHLIKPINPETLYRLLNSNFEAVPARSSDRTHGLDADVAAPPQDSACSRSAIRSSTSSMPVE